MAKNKIVAVAKKEKSGVKELPVGRRHKEIPGDGKRGFVDSKGEFVKRKEAAKIAEKAKQEKRDSEGVKKLHARDLKGSPRKERK